MKLERLLMRKIFILIGFMLMSCSQPHSVEWLRGSFTHALNTARDLNKPVLVDFYSDT